MKITRRQVLRGAAGFTLALPFLPSLVDDREASAGPAPYAKNPFFVAFATDHGGIWGANMFPADATLTEKSSYGGHEIRRGALELGAVGSKVGVCPVLSGASDRLTPALLAKLNVMRGLDIPFYIAHNTGAHVGNYARNDGNGDDGKHVQGFPRPTIDQVMAWSSSFYPDLSAVLLRSMTIGGSRMSYGWSSPGTKTGTIDEIGAERSSLALFNKIFVPPSDPAEKRPLIVDRVFEDYQRLRSGNRRLSTGDKQRLDDHMDRLKELERKLNVQVSCGDVIPPTADSRPLIDESDYGINPMKHREFYTLMNDVIVAAFVCGTSRIATVMASEIFSAYSGDWHQDIAHHAHRPGGEEQKTIADAHQYFFEEVFLDLAAKLDAVDMGNGVTLLDNTLITWSQESGAYTHDNQSMPVVTAGSAAGYFKTGNYVDYRNLGSVVNGGGYEGSLEVTHAGLSYSQWLGSILQAMGLPRAEFEQDGVGGYGYHYVGNDYTDNYDAKVFQSMSDILPFLKA